MKNVRKPIVISGEYHERISKLAEQERRPMGRQLEILIDIALPILIKNQQAQTTPRVKIPS